MFDDSHEIQYLDMVIEETLRMYPPAPVYVIVTYSQFRFLSVSENLHIPSLSVCCVCSSDVIIKKGV